MKKFDPVKQFVTLRDELIKEKAQLEAQLAAINRALGDSSASTDPSTSPAPQPTRASKNRGSNSLTLRQAVTQVLTGQSLTKREILTGVEKLGYRFEASDPMNSLNAFLYSNKKSFRNENGKWALANSPDTTAKETGQESSPKADAPKRKTMSPAARAKIAASQKERWAKLRKAATKKTPKTKAEGAITSA
jgi:hypothetical protein